MIHNLKMAATIAAVLMNRRILVRKGNVQVYYPLLKAETPPPPDEMYSFVYGIVDNSMYYLIYTCWVGGEGALN